jgi:hypothetical protein
LVELHNVTLTAFALTLVQIEISILNEPAATRTWLSLSESTEEFFMWTVCQPDSLILTTKTGQYYTYWSFPLCKQLQTLSGIFLKRIICATPLLKQNFLFWWKPRDRNPRSSD